MGGGITRQPGVGLGLDPIRASRGSLRGLPNGQLEDHLFPVSRKIAVFYRLIQTLAGCFFHVRGSQMLLGWQAESRQELIGRILPVKRQIPDVCPRRRCLQVALQLVSEVVKSAAKTDIGGIAADVIIRTHVQGLKFLRLPGGVEVAREKFQVGLAIGGHCHGHGFVNRRFLKFGLHSLDHPERPSNEDVKNNKYGQPGGNAKAGRGGENPSGFCRQTRAGGGVRALPRAFLSRSPGKSVKRQRAQGDDAGVHQRCGPARETNAKNGHHTSAKKQQAQRENTQHKTTKKETQGF